MGSTTTNVLITPLLANPPYDPVKDFAAITVFAYSSTSIVTQSPLRTTCRRSTRSGERISPAT